MPETTTVSIAVVPRNESAPLVVTKVLPIKGDVLVVLTDMVTELFASEPSALTLPAASAKTPLATLTTPLVVLLAVGVKVAV